MDENTLSTKEWLEREIRFINTEMAHTLNGRLKTSLLECDDREKTLSLSFPLESWEVNGLGTLHGGILSTMMDLAMSMVVYCFSRQTIPPTISMTTNYVRPVPMKEGTVQITARLTSLGKRTATAYCEASLPESGKLTCTSIGTYAIVPRPA